MKIIGVDVDGVLADFNKVFPDLLVKLTGRDLFPPRPFVIPCWEYPTFYGYTNQEQAKTWDYVKASQTFWNSLPAYPDAIYAADYLRAIQPKDADVYFVTQRPGLYAKLQTESWLRMIGVPTPTVLISGQKGMIAAGLGLTHYIDDRWENCLDVVERSPRTRVFLMARSWNWQYDVADTGITRVYKVAGFASLPVATAEPVLAH